MIKEEYKNGCRLKEQVKYNIDYDDCQILNLTCANYIYDLVQESSKYETKLEDIKKMLYMIEKLLGYEVQYDIPEYHRDSFDTLQDMKNYSENSLDDGHISYCKETNKHYKFNSNNQSDPTTGKWVEQHEAVPADEEDITEQNGTLQERPANIINKGFQYFDTTINKPIYWDGSKWIDATGATV